MTISLLFLTGGFADLAFAQAYAAQADSAEAAVECSSALLMEGGHR